MADYNIAIYRNKIRMLENRLKIWDILVAAGENGMIRRELLNEWAPTTLRNHFDRLIELGVVISKKVVIGKGRPKVKYFVVPETSFGFREKTEAEIRNLEQTIANLF